MIQALQATIDAANEAITLNTSNQMASATFILKQATNVSAVVIFEFLPAGGGTTWFPIAAMDVSSGTLYSGGNIALSDSTSYSFKVLDCSVGFQTRCRIVSISSGGFTADAYGFAAKELPPSGSSAPLGIVSATANGVTSSSSTAGIGYATGAGGTVTQTGSRTTTVIINKVCGNIVLVSAAGSATPFSFTVTNSTVAAGDVVVLSQKSGTDIYTTQKVTAVAAGSFRVTLANASGTTTEQPVFNFAVIKAVAA